MRKIKFISVALVLIPLLGSAPVAMADGSEWEYKVVIVQGVTAGGSLEKQSSGIYIDKKRTAALNELAADGWEIVSVVGAAGADHAVYLRRKARR